MTVAVPYDWIKEFPASLLERDTIPLMGHCPPFPWPLFQESINTLFRTEGLTLRSNPPQWRKAEELTTGIDHPVILCFNVEPIDGPVYWLLSHEDIGTVMSWLLTHTTEPLNALKDPHLLDGFYQFLAMECCHLISTSHFDQTLTPKMVKEQPLPTEAALCVDIGIGYQQEQEIRGRLVLSNAFYESWKNYYANRTTSLHLSEAMANQIELTVQLEAGRTEIRKSELAQAAPGDLLVLDHCSIQPEDHKGRVLLVVNGIPLFRGKLKQGNIKILELPLFYEESTSMGENSNGENHETDEEEYEEGDEESGTEHEESIEESHVEESHVEESHVEETATGEESVEEFAEEPIETKKVDLEELPITIKIEVGRLKMSVKKLLELQAGNLLELDVRPEDGVDLVVSGKCIGKGELVRIGETLGVRLLDLY